MLIIKLFIEFLKIGGFSFGGGLGTLPYVYEMAKRTSWITEEYITNILTVTQITPGPLACNIATIVGFKVSGLIGALVANIGFITPAICCMGVGYKIFNKIKNNNTANKMIKIVRSAALAVLISSSLTLFKTAFLQTNKTLNIRSIILAIILFVVCKKSKVNALYLMLISTILAIFIKV